MLTGNGNFFVPGGNKPNAGVGLNLIGATWVDKPEQNLTLLNIL